jgi:pimeloyl-ACP methyl ester carboxylesterase
MPDGRATFLDPFLDDYFLRPWLDGIVLRGLAHGLFPLSRAWAEAVDPTATVDSFAERAGRPLLPRPYLAGLLDSASRRRRLYDAAAANWEQCFFGPEDGRLPPPADLLAVESARVEAAHELMAVRSILLPLRFAARVPQVRWEVAPPSAVAARHDPRLHGGPQHAFPPGTPAGLETSRAARLPTGDLSWIRFPSRVGGQADRAWARVLSPRGEPDPPTFIFLHGLAMETEFWRISRLASDHLVEQGIRVVYPEGPWHGRRRAEGWFGGEPAIGLGPLGMLDLLEAWVAEIGALVRWARGTSRGRVAIGGLSLGALTSQLAAAAAADWPDEARPDALVLVATSSSMIEAAVDGSLGRALGAPERLAEAGWTPDVIEPLKPLLEPLGAPAIDPGRIVLLLGAADDVTPYSSGRQLARAWNVPSGNIFVRPQGHFTLAMGLARDDAPLQRLATLLKQ